MGKVIERVSGGGEGVNYVGLSWGGGIHSISVEIKEGKTNKYYSTEYIRRRERNSYWEEKKGGIGSGGRVKTKN